jgi:hypothetical protein
LTWVHGGVASQIFPVVGNIPVVVVIKECLVMAGVSLFNEFKNEVEICNAIKEVQLS